MPGRVPETPELPTMTMDQAIALLSRIQAGHRPVNVPTAVVFVVSLPSAVLPGDSSTTLSETVTKIGLMKLKKNTLDRKDFLVLYYYIGCAFQDGASSLSKVSEELERQGIDGYSCGNLSDAIRSLEDDVFADYFGNPDIRLLQAIRGEGRSKVLSDDGWRAWQETRIFLKEYYELPTWRGKSEIDQE
jgi:hypothetical protein